MTVSHCIGFDAHKKRINSCVKTATGQIIDEGRVPAERGVSAMGGEPATPWRGAKEATLFSAWIYDTLKPFGKSLEMAHPAMLKAITAGKKKSGSQVLGRQTAARSLDFSAS